MKTTNVRAQESWLVVLKVTYVTAFFFKFSEFSLQKMNNFRKVFNSGCQITVNSISLLGLILSCNITYLGVA